ncbi:uncharacterized protein CC84DRAFT_1236020 [Paraphaeosphaeria sporulosa]|uniref:Uncharacterized protein n=1 Tax=Paraphaeosphaeria sporulosa TaxID=1460663 RepID=A0A177CR58_9PLEO|nr:uncharacterized protein CC84DRAFT_1236020 [Paraphaeosphaeria sporulosa]OAG09995.1 hypothetical protein CC84DRAFT_1236020 [Paraphaeosphaeria sporulosa]
MSDFSLESPGDGSSETQSSRGGEHMFDCYRGTKLTILGVMIPTDRVTKTAIGLDAINANLKNGPIEDTAEKLQGLVDFFNPTHDLAVVEDDPVFDNRANFLRLRRRSPPKLPPSLHACLPMMPTPKKIVTHWDSMEHQRSNDKKPFEDCIANIEDTVEVARKIVPRVAANITALSNTAEDHTDMLRRLGAFVHVLRTPHDGTTTATNEDIKTIDKTASSIRKIAKDDVSDVSRQLQKIEKSVEYVDAGLSTIGKKVAENVADSIKHNIEIAATIQAMHDLADSMSSQLSIIQEQVVDDKTNEEIAAVSTQLERFGSTATSKLTKIEEEVGNVALHIANVAQNQVSYSSAMDKM